MAYKTTVPLDKLARTDYVVFGRCQDRLGRTFSSKNSFYYLDVKLEVFKKVEDKEFRLTQNLTKREADFIRFIRLRDQLAVAGRDFSKEKDLLPVPVKPLVKDMDEQLKLAHKFAEVVDRPHRKIWVTLLRYNVEKPETSYAQDRLFGSNKEEEKFNKIVHVNYKLGEFLYLFDLINFVCDKPIATETLCNVL